MKFMLSGAALAAAALFASAPASAAIVVSFSPSSSHVAIGDSVKIDMSISGLGSEILSAFDFNAIWNSSIATWSVFDVSSGCNQLGASSICGIDTVAAANLGANGSSVLSDDDLAAIQPDSFVIASFTLLGALDGFTTLTLGLDPDFERNFVGRDFLTLDTTVVGACVSVGTGTCEGGAGEVPEPASFGLAALGLLAAGAVGRRRRRA